MEAVRDQMGELQLLLTWQGREYVVGSNGLLVGRGELADLRLRPGCVSRQHAVVEKNARGARFDLTDHSTNGTYLQTEDGQVHHVHRQTVALWGEGYLSFGEPLTADRVVQFRHV